MGCDIHFHTEIKLKDKWEYFGEINIWRDYGLFSSLAGVRPCIGEENEYPRRGLPQDLSHITALQNEVYKSDWHSHSWLTLEEFQKSIAKTMEKYTSEKFRKDPYPLWVENYVNIGIFLRNTNKIRKEIDKNIEFRVIFWFDN